MERPTCTFTEPPPPSYPTIPVIVALSTRFAIVLQACGRAMSTLQGFGLESISRSEVTQHGVPSKPKKWSRKPVPSSRTATMHYGLASDLGHIARPA
jgi:hypothetical protein